MQREEDVRGANGTVRMTSDADVDAAIARLEAEMPDLQNRYRELFSYANAWAERHDAILAMVPAARLADVERRLQRVAIRWGMAPGVRMTGQFPVLKAPR